MENHSLPLEKLFQSHIEVEKTNLSRTMCLLGAFLYLLFAIVDYYLLSASLVNILLIRGFVITVLLSVFAYSHHKSFVEQYDLLFLGVYVLAAAGIEAMIYLAPPESNTSSIYLAGLILVIMTIFTWSYLKIWNALLAATIIFTSYTFLELYKGLLATDLAVNLSFLVSATAIGFMSQLNRDRYLRESFVLQKSLEQSVREKTIEANQDGLTGLANRRSVKVLLSESLDKVKIDSKKTLVVIFIDLNGFKLINDTHGHTIGDKVLTIIARRLELAVRKSDTVARLGGDEYLIGLLMKKNNLSKLDGVIEKFAEVISAPIRINGLKLSVSGSLGVAIYPDQGKTVNELIDSADKKMYLSKYEGKVNTVVNMDLNNTKKAFAKPKLTIVK